MKPGSQESIAASAAPSRAQLLSAPIRKEVERVLALMDAFSAPNSGSSEFIHRGRALLIQLPAELDDQITAEVQRRTQSEASTPTPISPTLTDERLGYYIHEMRGEAGAEEFVRFQNHHRKSTGFRRRRPTRTSICVELIASALRAAAPSIAIASLVPADQPMVNSWAELRRKYPANKPTQQLKK